MQLNQNRLILTAFLTSAAFLGGCQKHAPDVAAAAEASPADTAFVLVAAALVMLMTPALGIFYGGLVRSKNVLSVLMHCFAALGVITLFWVTIGYSLAFSPSVLQAGRFGLLGGLDWAFGRSVDLNPHPFYCPTIPHQLFMIFQCMFAIITPAIISGAFAERMKFQAYLLFIVLWSALVYCPIAHWVWSQHGWLREIGALDFAGGAVVHMTSGFTALVIAIMIRPRNGFPRQAFVPHNIVLCALGAGLLWFGWFGFNGGSALGAGSVAAVAFVSTHCAAAAGAVSWMIYDWLIRGKPTMLGTASGAVAGLVAVTPASGFVSPGAGIVIGLIAGALCAWVVAWRARRGIDDALDAFGIHGVGGALGAVLTGFFASHVINSAVAEDAQGLFYGGGKLVLIQLASVVITVAYSVIVSWALLKAIDATVGLRVTLEDEQIGLDLTQHNESAYNS